jgi:predicted RNA-binding protein with PUA-like domain
MNYWILKTEPGTYSFNTLLKEKKTIWDGVRNYQARNNIRAMKIGDLAIIYESVGPKAAVGIAKVSGPPIQDPKTREDWAAIEIIAIKSLEKAVTLDEMKKDKVLKLMTLVRNSRLSVCPLSKEEFKVILKKAGTSI